MKFAGFLFVYLALCFPFSAYTQTGDELETLLASSQVSQARAARFVLEAADTGSYLEGRDAFNHAFTQKWLPPQAQAEAPVSFGALSLLIMKSFGLKGGLFYSIFKNSHYAYRELVFRQIIPDSADPEQLVTGEEFLQIVNRVLDLQDQNGQPRMETERREAEQQRMAAEINTHLVERQVQDTKVSVGTEGVTISLSNINFQANSARLEEDEQAKIREIAEILKTLPGRKIMVAGHTALAGTEEAQMRTSTERAQAVADYLIQLGVRRRSEITVLGYGASRPVAPNTSAGQAQNRRVEITILERL